MKFIKLIKSFFTKQQTAPEICEAENHEYVRALYRVRVRSNQFGLVAEDHLAYLLVCKKCSNILDIPVLISLEHVHSELNMPANDWAEIASKGYLVVKKYS